MLREILSASRSLECRRDRWLIVGKLHVHAAPVGLETSSDCERLVDGFPITSSQLSELAYDSVLVDGLDPAIMHQDAPVRDDGLDVDARGTVDELIDRKVHRPESG